MAVQRRRRAVWELRGNLTAYDASYVAVAEMLGADLITLDARLAGATGPRCAVLTPPDRPSRAPLRLSGVPGTLGP